MSRLVRVWADSGYQEQDFMHKVMNRFRWILEAVKRSDDLAGFVVIPKRWIVEQSLSAFYRIRHHFLIYLDEHLRLRANITS